MSTVEDRQFVEHAKCLFPVEILRGLRQYLDTIQEERLAAAPTEREKAAVQRGETTDALRMDPRWFDAWRKPGAQLLKKVRPFTWVVFPPQVRIVREVSHLVPWHQDIAYQKNLGPRAHRQVFTCFVPLDEDPARRTTLQFALDRVSELRHAPMEGFGAGLQQAKFSKVEHYELSLGDCLLFGDWAPHRTYVPPDANVERRSLEFRLIQPRDALKDKDYFDIESGYFVRADGSKRVYP